MLHTSFPSAPAGLPEDLRAHMSSVNFVCHLGYVDTIIPACNVKNRFHVDRAYQTRSFDLVTDGICISDWNNEKLEDLVDTELIPWDNIVAIECSDGAAWARNKIGELQNLMTG